LDPVETVARALYEAQDEAHSWEAESLLIKNMFLRYADEAIALLGQNPHVPVSWETAFAELWTQAGSTALASAEHFH
jgi:hypothetical protein